MSRIIRTLKYREISKPSKIALIVTLLLMVSQLFIDYKSISASIKYKDLELHALLLSLGLMCLVPWVNMISKRKKSLKLYDDHMVFIYSDGEEETIEFSDIKDCFYIKKKKLVLNLNDQRDLEISIYSTARFEYIARAINQFNPRLIPDEVFSEIYESTLLLVYKKHKKGLELFLFVGNIFFVGGFEILVYIVTSYILEYEIKDTLSLKKLQLKTVVDSLDDFYATIIILIGVPLLIFSSSKVFKIVLKFKRIDLRESLSFKTKYLIGGTFCLFLISSIISASQVFQMKENIAIGILKTNAKSLLTKKTNKVEIDLRYNCINCLDNDYSIKPGDNIALRQKNKPITIVKVVGIPKAIKKNSQIYYVYHSDNISDIEPIYKKEVFNSPSSKGMVFYDKTKNFYTIKHSDFSKVKIHKGHRLVSNYEVFQKELEYYRELYNKNLIARFNKKRDTYYKKALVKNGKTHYKLVKRKPSSKPIDNIKDLEKMLHKSDIKTDREEYAKIEAKKRVLLTSKFAIQGIKDINGRSLNKKNLYYLDIPKGEKFTFRGVNTIPLKDFHKSKYSKIIATTRENNREFITVKYDLTRAKASSKSVLYKAAEEWFSSVDEKFILGKVIETKPKS